MGAISSRFPLRARLSEARRAFTLLEMSVALVILLTVMLLLAELTSYILTERGRLLTRQSALETANNVLETARATSWDKLTPAWAEEQKLPTGDVSMPSGAVLRVIVEPMANTPSLKQVTVWVAWQDTPDLPERNVELTGWFRSTQAAEGQP